MVSFTIIEQDEITSTNDVAKELVHQGKLDVVITAQTQTNARGRLGRVWEAAQGGLYATLVVKVPEAVNPSLLTFSAALAVVEAISTTTSLTSLVKWPNDVLLHNKKVCGILTELVEKGGLVACIGIGLNVNQSTFANLPHATSLANETQQQYQVSSLLSMIIDGFNRRYELCTTNPSKIITECKQHSHTLEKDVMITTLHGIVTGTAVNINQDGDLCVEHDGTTTLISEGDVQLSTK